MPAAPPARARNCPADPRCGRPPRFQVELYRAHQIQGQSAAVKTVDTCVDHLGDTVQALIGWAAATNFGRGVLQVSVVGGAAVGEEQHLAAFHFATIPLPLCA
jgi:hypothetical protein